MHPVDDLALAAAAVIAIGLSILLIVRAGLHPFIGLLCGAFVMGGLAGMHPQDTVRAIQQGFGDVMGGAGLVIALGLTLGAMLRFSGAAGVVAAAALRIVGVRHAGWGSLAASLLIGLPLFFETGVVLLLPIITAAAALAADGRPRTANSGMKLALMLPALAGLAIVHSLLPPHPGPLLAAHELGASVGRTMLFGFLIAIPTAVAAGPLFARFCARHIVPRMTPGVTIGLGTPIGPSLAAPVAIPPADMATPSLARALTVILLPVVLIAANAMGDLLPPAAAAATRWLAPVGTPVAALLIANLAGLWLLLHRRAWNRDITARIWHEAMPPAGSILLSIGAGGALKQVLVAAGMAKAVSRFADTGLLSPLVTAWCIAALIRLSTGSATVATITAAGLMPAIVARTHTSPEWTVLAIGAGSVFFSHVNDAGFWLVKGYLGTSTTDTFKTWSVMVTLISVLSLLLVLVASRLL
jgi:GntP family gluconate:H+ symporter